MRIIAAETPANIGDLKDRLKAGRSADDYGVVAQNLQTSAEQFLSRIPVEKGSCVLDVACGTGQVAFPAFRAGARVTGIDTVPDHQGKLRRLGDRHAGVSRSTPFRSGAPIPDHAVARRIEP